MAEAVQNPDLEELVRQLDDWGPDVALNAQRELARLGRETDVITPLLRLLPVLDVPGQTAAVLIITELKDARGHQGLIDLVLSETEDEVRVFAAQALVELRVTEAVPALRQALQGCAEGREELRRALIELGGPQPDGPR